MNVIEEKLLGKHTRRLRDREKKIDEGILEKINILM